MRVRLTCKLADEVDGIDLSHHAVGDTFDLPTRDARMLMAEGWVQRDRRQEQPRPTLVVAFRRANDPGPLRMDDEDLSGGPSGRSH